MKTLFKTYAGDHKKNIAKRRQFEAKTGLKWQSYHTGDGQRFVPIAHKASPIDNEAAESLMPYLDTNYRSFVNLSKRSGMSLSDVVSGAWTLMKSLKAFGTPCRMGGTYAIRLKYKWEIKSKKFPLT